MLFFSRWWLRPSHVNGVKNGGHLIFRWLRLTGTGLLQNECVARETSRLERAWLGLPCGNWCQAHSRCQTTRHGREACFVAEGGYHYVLETESRGRWGEERGKGYGAEESGGNRRGTEGFIVRDRTVYLVGWLPSRSKTLVFLCEFM